MTPWESIDAFLTNLGIRFGAPTPEQTTAGGHASSGEHYLGRARDYGDANSDVSGITAALVPYATGPNYVVDELFSSRDGVFLKNGQPITPSDALRQQHYDHVHVGLRAGQLLTDRLTPAGSAPSAVLASSGSGASSIGRLVSMAVIVVGGVALVGAGAYRASKEVR